MQIKIFGGRKLFGKMGETLRQIGTALRAFKGIIKLVKVVATVLLVMSCSAQAAEVNQDSASSLRPSTALSQPSVAVITMPITPSPKIGPPQLRLEGELRHLQVSQSTLLIDVLRYVLLAAAIGVLLFQLRHYWLTDKQPQAASRYVSVQSKFIMAFLLAFAWAALSVYLARYWFSDLSIHVGMGWAALVILGIAIVPGFMNAFLLASLMMDKRPVGKRLDKYPSFTILIAAYNEAAIIAKTLKSIDLQVYPAPIEVIVIDDGSHDETAAIVMEQMASYPWLKFIRVQKNGGKANALNLGLSAASHPLIVTLDADSYLYADSLQSIVERYYGDPPNTRVVAGTVLVQNSRDSWIAKAQEWDYFHGISAIKRVQSLYQGTLVAQGAFSLYDKRTLLEVGGWPDCVGEDIVLTWAILKRGYRVGHCEDACIFTHVPATLKQFSRQRQRWSRGMIEAFKKHPSILWTPRLSIFFIYWNLLFPVLDLVFTLFFIPGIVLAMFGYYWIVGPMTLALLPIAMAMNYVMFFFGKKMFTKRKLRVRTNIDGFLIYTLAYSLIMQPVCLYGYLSEILNLKKSWGTK